MMIMGDEEIAQVLKVLAPMGREKFGSRGEPLVRKDLHKLVSMIGN